MSISVDKSFLMFSSFCIPFQLAVFFDENNRGGVKASIRVNGSDKATMYKEDSNDDATNGDLIVVKLKKGDVVDVWISGSVGSNADTHFTGHLLFPL